MVDQNSNGMNEEKSRIEKLKNALYARGLDIKKIRRRKLQQVDYGVGKDWGDEPEQLKKRAEMRRKKPTISILLRASIIFFILSAAAASYFFFYGSNTISSKNIDITVQGPTSIEGGEELALQITITNHNPVTVKLADLIVEYPEGTRSATNLNRELPRYRESLNDIAPGEEKETTVRSVLFGEENSTKEIFITVEYRVEDSNAIFFKELTYPIVLSTAPVSIDVVSLTEVISGQNIDFDLTVHSNSQTILEDLLLRTEYPFGFTFKSAVPEPSFGNNVWSLGDLPPEGERGIKIKGVLEGQDNEERIFRFSSGLANPDDRKEYTTAFITSIIPVVVKKPFISVDIALNGEMSPEFTARSGQSIRADVTWANNLSTQIEDLEIEASIGGVALDKFSVRSDTGFYNSAQNTITWNKNTRPELGKVAAGASGRFNFEFAPQSISSGISLRNAEIPLSITIRGKRISDSLVPEEITSSVSRRVLVATDLLLAPRALYFSGPFINNGPMPPRAEKETTYTIVWTVTNSSNTVADASVTATLPAYTRWMGVVSPSTADISFNPIGGVVRWNAGDMSAGASSAEARKEVAFQVAIVPSVSQILSVPNLVNEQTVEGFDLFTQTKVVNVYKPLTTQLITDPGYRSGQETVQQ